MCGIAGFFGAGDEPTLSAMARALAHRGPDDSGTLLRSGIGLANTRLAIIDLSAAGHQPIVSADGALAVVLNGEIYNYKELRQELLATGAQLKGHSDTEVVLELYRREGTHAFKRLHGMFALAIADFKKQELILARDRFGKKPLYWGVFNGTLIFGSELKALMEHRLFTRDIDPLSLNKYLSFEYVPTPATIFRGVSKLEPGAWMRFDGKNTRTEAFYPVPFERSHLPFSEALARLDGLLEASVKERLVSDVPVGIFLSGGVDSSTIAYYAKKLKPDIEAFSIGFDDPRYDESAYASQAAKHLGLRHEILLVGVKEAANSVFDVLSKLDEPLADDSVVPTHLLSKMTRERVTVALGGDGGDELFAGYPTFQAKKLAAAAARAPRPLRKLAEAAARLLPVSHGHLPLDYRAKKFFAGLDAPAEHLHQRWLESFSDGERKELLAPGAYAHAPSVYEDLARYWREAADASPLARDSYLYLRTYLMDGVMVKVDRATMMASLEARAPFLDHRLAEFALSLPDSYKLRGFTGKYILKKLMEDRLPRDIVYRKKKGFALPVAAWMRGELKPLLTDMLSPAMLKRSGYFNESYVSRLLKEHMDGTHNHRQKLWTLLAFQIWFDRWAN